MTTAKRILTCSVGDIILCRNQKMEVSKVIYKGQEAIGKRAGERACVTACRIMDNGQVLRRSPQYIDEWSHL